MDYYPKSVVKSKPKKKIPETDAIFERVAAVNSEADKAPNTLRLSIDAKAQVKIGPFSRGGKNREILVDKNGPILMTGLAKRGIDEGKTKIGDEISFNRTFYEPEPPRLLAEIRADIEALEQKTDGLLEQT